MIMTRISIIVFKHPEHKERDFATISTSVVEQDFVAMADIPADFGEQKLKELAEKFNKTILTTSHETFYTQYVCVSY